MNAENMMLKLMLILSSSLLFASTECCRKDGNTSNVPFFTRTTIWSVFSAVSSATGGRRIACLTAWVMEVDGVGARMSPQVVDAAQKIVGVIVGFVLSSRRQDVAQQAVISNSS